MTKQPKRLKAQMWDKMQYLFRNYYDRMLHVRIDFDGMLDIAALKEAYNYMLERVPVLHSRFHNNFIKPYWSVKKIDIDSIVTLKQYSDPAKAERAAVGPGTTRTGMPAWWQRAAKSSPGSLMQGIPASVTTAQLSPAWMRRSISSPRSRRLCW